MRKPLVCAFVVLVACSSTRRNSGFGDQDPNSNTDPNIGLGSSGQPPCTGVRCQQVDCNNGSETTLTGTFYAPNGTLPLYNGIVYVPNTEPDALVKGVTCDTCGAVTGDPVVTTLSGADGTFTLSRVPVGKDIPLVLQIGKWRRQVKVPEVKACQENKLTDKDLTRLPKNQKEGNIPHIALTTGGCDKLGCMLPKIGLDKSEFGVDGDGPSKAVHTYTGSITFGGVSVPPGAKAARTLWNNVSKLKEYDLAILSCECAEEQGPGGSKDATSFAAMTEYMKAGGRIFTTDFMYTWYRHSPDPALASATSMRGGAPTGGNPMNISTSFPKGQALSDWLSNVGVPGGNVETDVTFANIISADPSKSQVWATSNSPQGPRVFTVNVPVGVPPAEQCGRGVHIDAHVNSHGTDLVDETYPNACNSALKPAENLLAFFFFDLASCIQPDGEPPKPPAIK